MTATAQDKGRAKEAVQVSDDTLDQFVGYHMKRAFNVIQADLSLTLKPYDLRMLTYTALVLIADNPGLSQSQLAAAMDVERPNLVAIADELEKRDLILREQVAADRRAYALTVTGKGRDLYEKAVAAVQKHEARILADLSPQQRLAIISAMQIIRGTHRENHL